MNITIRELSAQDEDEFISIMQKSKNFHHPWVCAPSTPAKFSEYLQKFQQSNQKSFLVLELDKIVGVINVSEIVRGAFQNAYISFYAAADFSGKGFMSRGLRLVLKKIFREMNLHRIEANIQPENRKSINFVKRNGFRYEGFSPRYLKINDIWCGHEHWAMTYEDYIQHDESVIEKDIVELVAYNPDWPQMAQTEIERVQHLFPAGAIVDIQHVGSTAIPGLSAKPIIDIQMAVRSLDEMKMLAVPLLQKLGYEYWADNPDPERMFFVKGMPPFGEGRTHHIHIFEPTSKHWHDKLLFRDYLLANPDMAEEYQQLKVTLAAQHTYDREAYTDAKGEFVKRILKLAGN